MHHSYRRRRRYSRTRVPLSKRTDHILKSRPSKSRMRQGHRIPRTHRSSRSHRRYRHSRNRGCSFRNNRMDTMRSSRSRHRESHLRRSCMHWHRYIRTPVRRDSWIRRIRWNRPNTYRLHPNHRRHRIRHSLQNRRTCPYSQSVRRIRRRNHMGMRPKHSFRHRRWRSNHSCMPTEWCIQALNRRMLRTPWCRPSRYGLARGPHMSRSRL